MQSLRNTLSGIGVCSEKLPGTRGEKIDNNLVKNKYAQSHFFSNPISLLIKHFPTYAENMNSNLILPYSLLIKHIYEMEI